MATPYPTKLNIGCGYDKRPGFLNIDVDPACRPDVLVKNNDLSFLPKAHFEHVIAYDVLEHIQRAHMMSALLDWASLMRIGGILSLQTTSIISVAELMKANDTFEFQYNWTAMLFGNQVHPGDFHYNGFTDRTLKVFLHVAGFDVEKFTLDDGWLLTTEVSKTRSWDALLEELRDADNHDFLKGIYDRIFKRALDETGAAAWGERLRLNSSRYDILKTIIGSPENLYKTACSIGL